MSGAVKKDEGKAPLDLVPRELDEAAARAFGFGARKYARGNWMEGGLTQSRLLAALKRHINAYNDREDNDPESGLCHLDHAAACLAMLVATRARGLGADDRLPEPKPKPVTANNAVACLNNGEYFPQFAQRGDCSTWTASPWRSLACPSCRKFYNLG